MALTWSQMARTALDCGRIWRGVVKERGIAEARLGFRFTDMVVTTLMLDLTETDRLVCPEATLRDLIGEVFAALPGDGVRQTLAAPDGSRYVLLTPLAGLGPGIVGPDAAARVVYGLAGFLPLAGRAGAGASGLRMLSCAAPALWQCGLALVAKAPDDPAVAALVEHLAQSMRGEWIDPLALYERVQVLTAKLSAVGQIDHGGDVEPEQNRVAELERELSALKRAALVNQHLLLVDAAERVRFAT